MPLQLHILGSPALIIVFHRVVPYVRNFHALTQLVLWAKQSRLHRCRLSRRSLGHSPRAVLLPSKLIPAVLSAGA
ncbi:hypothetical protein DPV78_007993 [Talaromyces pinophilus]|nr:hypothetical protein DPV78_007993 [Talaromyces pinophilus]